MRQVIPLGFFSSIAGQASFSRNAEEIKTLSGQIPKHERARMAAYLRQAPVIIALMGYIDDFFMSIRGQI
jgi:hypothetical protein